MALRAAASGRASGNFLVEGPCYGNAAELALNGSSHPIHTLGAGLRIPAGQNFMGVPVIKFGFFLRRGTLCSAKSVGEIWNPYFVRKLRQRFWVPYPGACRGTGRAKDSRSPAGRHPPLCPFSPLTGFGDFRGLKKQTSNVRLAPNSGHSRGHRRMSAFDPKRTLVALGVYP